MNRRLFFGCIACACTAGCSFDNGLPASLAQLLKSNGIDWPIQSSHAALASGRATLSLMPNEEAKNKAIEAFELLPIALDSAPYRWLTQQLHLRPMAAWGRAGRASPLRLASGRELEYFYLVQTSDENMLILIAYAYSSKS